MRPHIILISLLSIISLLSGCFSTMFFRKGINAPCIMYAIFCNTKLKHKICAITNWSLLFTIHESKRKNEWDFYKQNCYWQTLNTYCIFRNSLHPETKWRNHLWNAISQSLPGGSIKFQNLSINFGQRIIISSFGDNWFLMAVDSYTGMTASILPFWELDVQICDWV